MKRNEILVLLKQHKTEFDRLGVKNLALFGSVARDQAQEDSDIDILVEFNGSADFSRFMELKFGLEEILGRPVDLVTRKALKPSLRARVEAEAVQAA